MALVQAAARLRMQQESKPDHVHSLERAILTARIEKEALKHDHDAASTQRRAALEERIRQQQDEYDRLMAQWEEEKRVKAEYNAAKEQLEAAQLELQAAIRQGDYNRAGQLTHVAIPQLVQRVQQQRQQQAGSPSSLSLLGESVTSEDVAAVVARHTGIPVSRLLVGERQRLLQMEASLRRRVVGQDAAVASIANCIRIARAGLHAHTKPMGCFLFLGNSGVGKTELAKALADFLFDDAAALLRIDMTEYSERHSVSRLIGAPPGYVGYEEGGQLTEAVRRRPYQVVLLDEIEKAHRQVCNVLLQVMDEGHLTDGQGRRVDFRNTVIIATSQRLHQHLQQRQAQQPVAALTLACDCCSAGLRSGNLGSSLVRAAGSVEETEQLMREAARSHFPPEFINRLDDIVSFRPLTADVLPGIVDIQVQSVCRLLLDQQVELDIGQDAKRWLGQRGYDPELGARPLKRVIYAHLLTPLAKQILAGSIRARGKVRVSVDGPQAQELRLSYTPPPDESEAATVQPLEPLLEPDDDDERRQPAAAAAAQPPRPAAPGSALHSSHSSAA